jgi:hypothetical protein
MKTLLICMYLITLCGACAREKVYSYAEALSYQSISSESERVITTVGTTNGTFSSGPCTVLTSAGQKVIAKSRDGSTVSWVRSKDILGEVRCYHFENEAGRQLIVVKELETKESVND